MSAMMEVQRWTLALRMRARHFRLLEGAWPTQRLSLQSWRMVVGDQREGIVGSCGVGMADGWGFVWKSRSSG
jgi:hypothetical protein